MTPEERISKICELCPALPLLYTENGQDIKEMLIAQISEAEKEARSDECAYWSCMDDRLEENFKHEGFRLGIEAAARIALMTYKYDQDALGSRRELECSQNIAEKIRALPYPSEEEK